MRFVNQYEFWGDVDEAIVKWRKYLEERERTPEKFPRYIFQPHWAGEVGNGICVIDSDTEEQLLNHITFLWPEIKVKLTEKTGEIEFRLVEGSDEFIQLEALLASFVLAGLGKQ